MIMHHPELVTDLEKLDILGKLREDENYRFKNFLKGQNSRKVDLLVHRINAEIAPKIDCTACGNCCKHLSPNLTKEDLKNLTGALQIPVEEVIEKYTGTMEHELSLKHLPCSFLQDNKCGIYCHRPEACASFPHLHQTGFVSRLRRVIDNYSICPIIFNVLERLKQ